MPASLSVCPMPKPSKPSSISIRDVAHHAGVSLGSASRVVNKVPNVSEATRLKVEAAIEALGYRPNHAAQSLRRRNSRTIGCLFTDVTNPLYAQLFRAAEECLLAEGYMLLLANGLNDPEREVALLGMFQGRGMDGLLIAPGNERDPRVLRAVEALDIPVVVLDRDMVTHKDQVLFDHEPGMHRVVDHLAGLGHRRIALVLAQTPNRPMSHRVEGFRTGLGRHGITRRPEWLVQLPTSTSSAFDEVTALLALPERPTALIVQGTNILNDSLNAIQAAGLRIPHDVSLVSLGDPDFARHHLPAITALRVNLKHAATESARLLVQRIRGEGPAEAAQVHVEADFVERASCGPAPG